MTSSTGSTAREREDLAGILEFLRNAERLKTTLRSAHTSAGRQESVAEHSWRLCLMALVVGRRTPDVDLGRLLAICIVHDLGEAISGDIPAPEQSRRLAADPGAGKATQERQDLVALLAPLPAPIGQEIVALWDDYEAAASPEASLAKGLDKLETILQHTQGANPPGFDYRYNLDYGRRYTASSPILAVLRAILDQETERRASEADHPVPPENFIVAAIDPDRHGPDQPEPVSPDEQWPEAPDQKM